MAKTYPAFSLISFVWAPGTSTNQAAKINLDQLFNAVVNCHKLEVYRHHLEEMLHKDLSIGGQNLNERLMGILGEALMYYMTIWPGWHCSNEYYSGRLSYKEWFASFRRYLMFKSTFVVRAVQKFSKDVITTDETTQTDASDGSRTAPYTIVVTGPPMTLNNILFLEENGNILLKQLTTKSWPRLKTKELLNWPYVSVEVKLPDVSLSRNSTPRVQRYVSLSGVTTDIPKVPDITHVTRIPEAAEHDLQPYSYEFIASYFQQLNEVLKMMPGLAYQRLAELEAIFTEYLADIKEVNINNSTMCAHISLGYHIGKCKYIRPRKVVSKETEGVDEKAIIFTEIVIPQTDLALQHFEATQDLSDTKSVTFHSLNKLRKNLSITNSEKESDQLKLIINNLCVTYNCTLCSQTFSGPDAQLSLTTHFQFGHRGERPLICLKCRKKFEVQILAGQRWMHVCS